MRDLNVFVLFFLFYVLIFSRFYLLFSSTFDDEIFRKQMNRLAFAREHKTTGQCVSNCMYALVILGCSTRAHGGGVANVL